MSEDDYLVSSFSIIGVNSIPKGIMSGFLSMLSALASLNRTPFCIDGDNVELMVMVLLRLARALSRRLELLKRTTRIIADSISNRAPKIPNRVPRNGLIWRNVGARAGEKSENGNTTATQGSREDEINMTKRNIVVIIMRCIPVCFSGFFTV